ncbi:MAG: DUF4494 domain-containing protein [Alloprevotella sp.]
MQFYEVKISYRKMMENGMEKAVKEQYLMKACSFTDAEAKMVSYISPYVKEFSVVGIKIANYSEFLYHGADDDTTYFRCKVNLITLDEKSGKEKMTPVYYLVDAKDIDSAKENLTTALSDTMQDYTVESIAETNIVDYIAE